MFLSCRGRDRKTPVVRMDTQITITAKASTEGGSQARTQRVGRRDDGSTLKEGSSLGHSAVQYNLEIEIDDADSIVDEECESPAQGYTFSAHVDRTATASVKALDTDGDIHQMPAVGSEEASAYNQLLLNGQTSVEVTGTEAGGSHHGDGNRSEFGGGTRQGADPNGLRSPSNALTKETYENGGTDRDSIILRVNNTGRPSSPQEAGFVRDENSTLVSEVEAGKFSGSPYGSEGIRLVIDIADRETTDKKPASNKSKSRHGREWRRNARIIPSFVLNEDGDAFEDEEYFASPDSPYPDPDSFGSWHS